jgi:hypothetical protein
MKNILKISIFIILQNLGILAAWIVLAAYLKLYTIVIIIIIIIIQAFLLRFSFGLNQNQRNQDSGIDGAPEKNRQSESENVFWIAVLTSWICPTTVWSNNIINKYNNARELNDKLDPNISALKRFQGVCKQLWNYLKHLRCLCRLGCFRCREMDGTKDKNDKASESKENNRSYKRRSRILITTSAATITILLLSLIVLIVLLKTKDLNFTTDNNPPITHCTKFRLGLIPGKLKWQRERQRF